MHLLIYIDVALFIFIAFFIGYDLFFTLTSFFKRKRREPHNKRFQKFAIIFAAYKEDQVILESIEHILLQDYRGFRSHAKGYERDALPLPNRIAHTRFRTQHEAQVHNLCLGLYR